MLNKSYANWKELPPETARIPSHNFYDDDIVLIEDKLYENK